ncbi:hypothetical protein CCMA1212_000479 [Trichoderma ghanense]|uniref:Uncharacterized protein n=1 Tax=Trichoderma ghanense TaxID=65468 RepID=A0ABY2HH49_9HYPO
MKPAGGAMQCGAESRAAGWRLAVADTGDDGLEQKKKDEVSRLALVGLVVSALDRRLGGTAKRAFACLGLDWTWTGNKAVQASKQQHSTESRAEQCRAEPEQGRCNFVCASGVRASALFRRTGGVAVVGWQWAVAADVLYSGRVLRPRVERGAWALMHSCMRYRRISGQKGESSSLRS